MRNLILLHGALGDRTQLEPLEAALEGRYRCHLVEFEGHGRTVSPHPYSVARFRDNVREFMAERRIERASVFGYSMGGYVALALAAESTAIDQVATLATKLAWTPDGAAAETRRLDPVKIRAKVPAFAELLERRHAGSGGWEQVLRRTVDFMTGLGTQPVMDDALLARIGQPVRLLVGDRDTVVSVEETTRAAQIIPNGKAVVLPGVPHPFEQVPIAALSGPLREFFG